MKIEERYTAIFYKYILEFKNKTFPMENVAVVKKRASIFSGCGF